MFVEFFSSGPLETNTVILGCSKTHKAVIIDVPIGSTQNILKTIRKNSLHPEMILLTHSHWDHIGEVSLLKSELKIPVYIHKEDAGNLENPGSDRLPILAPILGVLPDGFLTEGQVINVGELEIHVIHTPGHTPGCVCFYLPKENLLISGDTLFRRSIGNLSLPTARPNLMPESLKKLSKLPPETRVIPGHGEETTIGAEKKYGGYL